jgi:lipopolysaccharide transport system permease protein
MQEIRVYSPDSGVSSPVSLIKEILKGFKDGKFLAYQLFVRDLKASVRQSFLGFFWHFIPAIAQALIWILLNSQKIVSVENIPMASYPAFAITGTILWTLFTEGVTKPLSRFNAAKGMMVKLNFPREAIVLATFYDLLFSLLLKLIVLFPALIIMGYYPELDWLFAIAAILPMYLLSLSFGLILVPLGMLYTDISRGLLLAFQMLMYLSPVVFAFQDSGTMGIIHKLNPVSPFIEYIRSSFGDYAFHLQFELILWSIIGFVLFLISLVVLKLSLPAILERSGS